jgi:hypothetical protein
MAEEVIAFVASTGTLPVGTAIMFDSVTVGGSTGKAEMIKLLDGTAGSTTPILASSAPIGAVGLNVAVVNSTSNPIGVSIAAGQSTVTVSGNVNVTFSTASTASVNIQNTTASPGIVQLALSNALVSTTVPLPVLLQTSTATVTIQGNSTAIISTASKIVAQLSSADMGGSTLNFVYVINKPWAPVGNSTWNSTKITSSAIITLFSSAASTRFYLTDVVMTNAGTVETVATIYDTTSTTGTVLFKTDLASAGGGVAIQFATPRRTAAGAAMGIECVPASTVYVNVGAFRAI